MLSVQPVYPWRYLSWRATHIPDTVKRLFYLSWEDALWDLLAQKQVPKKSMILTPDFFCVDVEQNMILHGYQVEHYSVSQDLQTSPAEFITALQKYQPAIVVIFHAVGITNTLLTNTEWLKYLPPDALIIEDCVHRVVEPINLNFLNKNHLKIDSLRKVVPLQGSVVYGLQESLTYKPPKLRQASRYAFSVTLYWLLMQAWLTAAQALAGRQPSKWLATKAEAAMLDGYEIVGDSLMPAAGWFVFDWGQQRLNFAKIKKNKAQQARIYLEALKLQTGFRLPSIKDHDWAELRGLPLILDLEIAEHFLETVRQQGLMLRFELADSAWSQQRKIVYLPLGPHLRDTHIKRVSEVVNQAIQAATSRPHT